MPLLPAKRSEVTPEEGLRGGSDEEDGGCGIDGSRKKLRLSKDQSAVLEDSFREHPTLNPVTVSNHHPVRQEQTSHQWMNSGPQSFTSKLADLDLNRAALWRAAAEGSLSCPR